jgi:hypothetical protein
MENWEQERSKNDWQRYYWDESPSRTRLLDILKASEVNFIFYKRKFYFLIYRKIHHQPIFLIVIKNSSNDIVLV